MLFSDTQIAGFAICSFGLIFMIIAPFYPYGLSLMVNSNFFFLAGLGAIIGFENIKVFFSRKDRLMGTIIFVVGILIFFTTLTHIGLAIELFGFVSLFKEFFPMIANFLKELPYIDTLSNHLGISKTDNHFTEPKQSPA